MHLIHQASAQNAQQLFQGSLGRQARGTHKSFCQRSVSKNAHYNADNRHALKSSLPQQCPLPCIHTCTSTVMLVSMNEHLHAAATWLVMYRPGETSQRNQQNHVHNTFLVVLVSCTTRLERASSGDAAAEAMAAAAFHYAPGSQGSSPSSRTDVESGAAVQRQGNLFDRNSGSREQPFIPRSGRV